MSKDRYMFEEAKESQMYARQQICRIKDDYPMFDMYTFGKLYDECRRKSRFREPSLRELRSYVDNYITQKENEVISEPIARGTIVCPYCTKRDAFYWTEEECEEHIRTSHRNPRILKRYDYFVKDVTSTGLNCDHRRRYNNCMCRTKYVGGIFRSYKEALSFIDNQENSNDYIVIACY